VYLIDLGVLLIYDPASDEWSLAARTPVFVHANTAGIAPGDRITMLGDDGEIYIWPGHGGDFEGVLRPMEARSSWSPIFLTGPDGYLWAVDDTQPFVYTGF
jgi:hypothetical protein